MIVGSFDYVFKTNSIGEYIFPEALIKADFEPNDKVFAFANKKTNNKLIFKKVKIF